MDEQQALDLAIQIVIDDLTNRYFFIDQLPAAREYVDMLSILTGKDWQIVQYYIRDEMRFCIREGD